MLLTYEATRDLPLEETMVETPVAMAKTYTLAGRKLGIVPILRAGLGMVDGMLCLIPAAKVGPHRPVPRPHNAQSRGLLQQTAAGCE